MITINHWDTAGHILGRPSFAAHVSEVPAENMQVVSTPRCYKNMGNKWKQLMWCFPVVEMDLLPMLFLWKHGLPVCEATAFMPSNEALVPSLGDAPHHTRCKRHSWDSTVKRRQQFQGLTPGLSSHAPVPTSVSQFSPCLLVAIAIVDNHSCYIMLLHEKPLTPDTHEE